MTEKGFELREVISGGRRLVKNGELQFKEKFLEESNRNIVLRGDKNRDYHRLAATPSGA